jgi:hypothetical protein
VIPKPAGGHLALPDDSASFEWGIKHENQMARNDEHSVRPGDERA